MLTHSQKIGADYWLDLLSCRGLIVDNDLVDFDFNIFTSLITIDLS